jgi:N-acetylglucosamine-6-sulfatase
MARAVRWLAGLVALLALPCAATASRAAHAVVAAARPNIVVIETDDQTVESMRVMANVNRLLAARGATFDNSFASFSLCAPSRATFLTGQYSHDHGVVGNNIANGLARLDQASTLPVWLRRGGYSTVLVGKYLNEYGQTEGRTIPPGWTEWYGAVSLAYYGYKLNENGRIVKYGNAPADYQTNVLTSLAVDAIRRRAARPKPFFLWLTYFAPHYGGPREPDDPAGLKTPVAGPDHKGALAGEPLPQPPSFDEADVSDKPAAIRNRPVLSADTIAALTSSYRQRLEALFSVDDGVAKVVAALRSAGVLDNTLVVFTSDNGFLQGEHRVVDSKEFVYEPSVRVPLVMRGPGVPHGVHLSQLVANVDLAPTILEAARVPAGRVEDGRSLFPLLADPGLEWGRDLLLERGPAGSPNGQRVYTAVRTPRFVYAEYATGERELYDLTADPDELQNLDGNPAYAAVESELAAELAALRDCAGAACQQPPHLELDPVAGPTGDCVRSVRVGGADEPHVVEAEFAADGRPLGSLTAHPLEQALTPDPAASTTLRATAVLDDGRRLTLELSVRVCPA